MNRRMILYVSLRILTAEALLLLLPALVSALYRERSGFAFLICAGAGLAVTLPLTRVLKPKNTVIYAREGFVTVALSWIFLSLFGALPFVISGEIPNYVDAVFETASGFTTTGASILTEVEMMSRGCLFWRSFTHWLGGMGVLVFLMALTNMSDRPIHIMRAEMPGPIVGKLVPRARDTAKILYLIYMGLSATETVLLLCGGMPLFDSLIYTFGTAGTGGFGLASDSLVKATPFIQWVITVFMMIFGVNFNLYYLLIVHRAKEALKSGELWTYAAIAASATALVLWNIRNLYASVGGAVRAACFQVASIMTTTGFSTADFDTWPQLSKTVLLILMFIGACAGSTAGGLKVSRVMLLFKILRRELRRMLHPNAVRVIRLEGKRVDDGVLHNTCAYLMAYCVCFLTVFLLLSFDRFDTETAFSASAACFNNIGPALGFAGPMRNYAMFSPFSKITLTAAMLLGRLEIFPILLAFAPYTWVRK